MLLHVYNCLSFPIRSYSRGKRLIFTNHRFCNCLQGVAVFRRQAGAACKAYVSQRDREKMRYPVSSSPYTCE